MSGVYKSIQPKDVRTTPYRAHKTVVAAFDGNETSDECKVFVGQHSLSSSYESSIQGTVYLDTNPYYSSAYATTTDGYYSTAIHAQLDHLFYREYLDNTKATLGGGAPINLQYRELCSNVRVISFPTKTIGEGILPESLQITSSGFTMIDDGYGNVLFSQGGSNSITSYDAADYDNVMTSYTFNKYYKYVGEGTISNLQQTSTYGSYKLQASYTNVSFNTADTSGSVSIAFASESKSNIRLVCNNEMKDLYNMFNRDYAIAFKIKLKATPTTSAVVLTKAEPEIDVAVDLEGNLYTSLQGRPMFPYKILVNTSRQIVFNKSDGLQTITMNSSALTLDVWYDVVIQRNASHVFQMYVNGALVASVTDVFIAISNTAQRYLSREQDCGSRSDLYVGSAYDGSKGLTAEMQYLHIFDRELTANEVLNLYENSGWLGNYCGNVFYNLGLITLTHPKVVNQKLTQIHTKSTVSMTEIEVYCTVGPGEFTTTHNRTVQYWNPTHNAMEIATRYTSSLFRPYITTVGLYNDKNELLGVGKMSTPIQTSKNTDTTFVLRFDF